MDNSFFPLGGDIRIDLGQPNENFITASVAAVVDSFLLVFVGYTNGNGVSYISGVCLLYYSVILCLFIIFYLVCYKEYYH